VTFQDTDPKPGFVVADALLGTVVEEKQLRFFLNKCRVLRNQRRLRPFMAILLSDGFTLDALRATRKSGAIAATPRNLFGDTVADALLELVKSFPTNSGPSRRAETPRCQGAS